MPANKKPKPQKARIKLDKDGKLAKKLKTTDNSEGCAAGESLLTSDLAAKRAGKWAAPTAIGGKGKKA